jgi:putative ABC transport system ATP-binding protein
MSATSATHRSKTPLIETREITRVFGKAPNEFQALRGVSVSIASGDGIAIVGKSGSGKSTLMHILAALDRPSAGEVWFEGNKVSDFDGGELAMLRNHHYAFIFQQFYLMARQTVLENVTLQLKIRGVPKGQRDEAGMYALKTVDLQDKAKNRATDLSGGQKQRVAIARALVANPQVLFADEPTGNLDSKTGAQIIETLFRINHEKGITLIAVTHDHEFARMFPRTIEIADGLIVNA